MRKLSIKHLETEKINCQIKPKEMTLNNQSQIK